MIRVGVPVGTEVFYDDAADLVNVIKGFLETGQATGILTSQEGGFFIRALEKDYREPVTNTKPPPPPKKKRVEPKHEEPLATDEERAQTSAKLKEFIQTLRTSK